MMIWQAPQWLKVDRGSHQDPLSHSELISPTCHFSCLSLCMYSLVSSSSPSMTTIPGKPGLLYLRPIDMRGRGHPNANPNSLYHYRHETMTGLLVSPAELELLRPLHDVLPLGQRLDVMKPDARHAGMRVSLRRPLAD
eukprot:scaffold243558_cov17-Prasinocladus_malaysianus.AAC.2